jgi:glycosyltransferase involved in cell wall biosynthesis
MFPEAPIYTLLYDKEAMGGKFSDRVIYPSILQKLPKFFRRHYRWLLPFCASAIEAFDLREYDVVISSSGAWSKGVVTKLRTKHLAYIHSPMRFVWDYNNRYLSAKWGNSLCRRFLLSYIRVWDRIAADRPDVLIANSCYTKKRIEKYYHRQAKVIYPGVDLGENFDREALKDKCLQEKKYFLVVSRLTQSKNVSLVTEAFRKLQFPLIVIGEGYDAKSIQKCAGGDITFLGYQSDKEVARYMANAQALIFPAEDDFGIVAVEAMQLGTPVIALGKGGALETVKEGISGIFFEEPVSVMVADAVRKFLEHGVWNRDMIRKNALCFSKRCFRKEILAEIEKMERN